jgi:hypothetical protein
MAYGTTREAAISAVRALALRVAADCIDHGEDVPPQFEKVFPLHEPLGTRRGFSVYIFIWSCAAMVHATGKWSRPRAVSCSDRGMTGVST